ncbi:MAG: helix-turn-helix domain-containing protein [Thermoguttaceae bacterium]|jgi:excisionase family DNA binding protein
MAQTATNLPPVGTPAELPDVMTLAEAAGYLRLSEGEVLELVRDQGLPSRRIGNEWRFLRAAIQDWLRIPETKDFWSRHFGALKNDPYLGEILQRVDSDRRQAAAEE